MFVAEKTNILDIDRLSNEIITKIIDFIKDIKNNANNFHADNIENLIKNLAQEIENKKERLNFITAANKIL